MNWTSWSFFKYFRICTYCYCQIKWSIMNLLQSLSQRANESCNDLRWSFRTISKHFKRKHYSDTILYREITCRHKCSPLLTNFLLIRISYWIFGLSIGMDRSMIYFTVDRQYFLIVLNQKKYYGLSSSLFCFTKTYWILQWSQVIVSITVQ